MLLEQLVTSELERALEEISSGSGTEAGQQRAGTLLCDHLSESAEEALVVCDGVELDSCLDAGGRWLSVQKFLVLSRQGRGQLSGRKMPQRRDLHIDGSESTVGN